MRSLFHSPQESSKKTTPLVCIENMHGFDLAVAELALPGVQIFYADLPTLIAECIRRQNVLGIVKGPRTRLRKAQLDLLACMHPGLVIAYPGRHPCKVLAPDIPYTFATGASLSVQTSHGCIPMLALAQSPLSSAVCAYTVKLSEALLQGRYDHISSLSISAGNTFDRRMGHSFTEGDLSGTTLLSPSSVAIIGAGDIGVRVIQHYAQAGVQVTYTATREHACLAEQATFVSLAHHLQHRPHTEIVTLHVPPGVKIPLEQVRDVGLFINTSSGSCVDNNELINALEERRIHRALIDVFDHEGPYFNGVVDIPSQTLIQSQMNPFPHDLDASDDLRRKKRIRTLIEEKRLFLTPHIAYLEKQAVRKTLTDAVEMILCAHDINQPVELCN